MFGKTSTERFTKKYLENSADNYAENTADNVASNISVIKDCLESADAILLGAGAGLSTAAGLTYSGERFERYFSDFRKKYNIRDMYSGGFYPFPDLETYWAWWSRHIWYNRYAAETNGLYGKLFDLLKDKNYFIITTNVDHQFQLNGFDKKRLFYMQGDYGLFQCSERCHQVTYDNRVTIEAMIREQKEMKIPSELIPYCPKCGEPMVTNLRSDDTFVQDEGWYHAKNRYDVFLRKNKDKKLVLFELGVGMNTPVWIKYPFLQMAAENPIIKYICINREESDCPYDLSGNAIRISGDINGILNGDIYGDI